MKTTQTVVNFVLNRLYGVNYFQSKNQIILQTIFRQTDIKYAKILNKLRVGKMTTNGIAELQKCVGKPFIDELNPTIILPRRKDVDVINTREFNKLDRKAEKIFIQCLA